MCASARCNRNGAQPEDNAAPQADCCRCELFLQALASPRRLALVMKLCDGEMSVTELTEWMGLSQPTISHHLNVLRRAGLVNVRHVAQQRFYRADTHCLTVSCHCLSCQLHAQPSETEHS